MTLKEGDILLGRYRIDGKLGEGGMGAVYRAHDVLHGQDCALKEFLLGYLPSRDETQYDDGSAPEGGSKTPRVTRERAAEQFLREAQTLARLGNPHLPKVTDFFGTGSEYYLVMTLIEGEDLASKVENAGGMPLPEGQVLGWMDQVLDALAYCHKNGVIHRDVKPANIIVTPAGRVYLVDFGIARPSAQGGGSAGGPLAVTPGYSPPEQYEGRGDARSDLYSLGATMYALLTLHQPLPAERRRAGQQMAPPRQLVPGLSPMVSAAVMRALALKPEDRFASAAAMRCRLRLARLLRGCLWPALIGGAALVLLSCLTLCILIVRQVPAISRLGEPGAAPARAGATREPTRVDLTEPAVTPSVKATGGPTPTATLEAPRVTTAVPATLTETSTPRSTVSPTRVHTPTPTATKPPATATAVPTTAIPPTATPTSRPVEPPTPTLPPTATPTSRPVEPPTPTPTSRPVEPPTPTLPPTKPKPSPPPP